MTRNDNNTRLYGVMMKYRESIIAVLRLKVLRRRFRQTRFTVRTFFVFLFSSSRSTTQTIRRQYHTCEFSFFARAYDNSTFRPCTTKATCSGKRINSNRVIRYRLADSSTSSVANADKSIAEIVDRRNPPNGRVGVSV